jgi:rfaE bifunctional protein nucleotidyltransferase chain/domain
MTEDTAWNTTPKCLSPSDLLAMAPRLPRPLVFTNGVFDLLHAGHVACLEQARAHGAALVVALNSDASAHRLGKGPGRPVNALGDRARVLAALACVSWVSWFDEDTPEALLGRLRPDVYVKGGDYRLDQLPEARLLAEWGGRTVLMPYLEGRSSTAMIQRICGPAAAGAQ